MSADGVQSDGTVSKFYRGDLQRAQIAVTDDKGRSVDLHALRTTFGTWLAQTCPEQARRALMRHAPRTVTERSYTDLQLLDLWGEIAKLPRIPKPTESVETIRATGSEVVSSGDLVGLRVGLEAVRKGVKLP